MPKWRNRWNRRRRKRRFDAGLTGDVLTFPYSAATDTGWIGPLDELMAHLEGKGADRGSDGQFLIHGDGYFGIGGDELVLRAGACYQRAGRRCPLIEGSGDRGGAEGDLNGHDSSLPLAHHLEVDLERFFHHDI